MQGTPNLLPAKIHSLEKVGDKYLLVSLKVPEPYPQKPGQYCFVYFKSPESDIAVPYSIASEPRSNGLLDFCLVLADRSKMRELLTELKVGDELRVSPAQGRFSYPKPELAAVFIAGGSGIAPLRSMILNRYLVEDGTPRATSLLYGCERADEIPYFNEFNVLAEKHPNFDFQTFIKEAAPKDSKHQVGLPTAGLGPTLLVEASYYLCGPPAMVEASEQYLLENNVPKKRIFTDRY